MLTLAYELVDAEYIIEKVTADMIALIHARTQLDVLRGVVGVA